MPILLNSSQALDVGDKLWILPNDSSTYWYQRINWLTNFSLTSNELHIRPKLHPWLVKIIETCEIPMPVIPTADPLLVPISHWLPSEWLVLVPFQENNKSLFFNTIKNIWFQLQEPTLRLFLPSSVNVKDWESFWDHQNFTSSVSLVLQTKEEESLLQ